MDEEFDVDRDLLAPLFSVPGREEEYEMVNGKDPFDSEPVEGDPIGTSAENPFDVQAVHDSAKSTRVTNYLTLVLAVAFAALVASGAAWAVYEIWKAILR